MENQKTINQAELNKIVRTSKFPKDIWNKIIDLEKIDSYISNPCNKLGTSKYIKDKPEKEKNKLIKSGKKILKIVMRSVKRKILRCCDG